MVFNLMSVGYVNQSLGSSIFTLDLMHKSIVINGEI